MRVIRKLLGFPLWLLGAVCALGIVVGNIGAPIFSKSITVFLGFPTHEVENATEELYFPSSYETLGISTPTRTP